MSIFFPLRACQYLNVRFVIRKAIVSGRIYVQKTLSKFIIQLSAPAVGICIYMSDKSKECSRCRKRR